MKYLLILCQKYISNGKVLIKFRMTEFENRTPNLSEICPYNGNEFKSLTFNVVKVFLTMEESTTYNK